MPDASIVRTLLQGQILLSVSNFQNVPMRTGIQRVLYEFCKRWPMLRLTVPFVAIGMDRIGILGPEFYKGVDKLFDVEDDVLSHIYSALHPNRRELNTGYFELVNAPRNIIAEVAVADAVEQCRAVISLEESLNGEFFSIAARTRPDKIFNLCHDFLIWTRPEFFPSEWNGVHLTTALANRRLYHHNFFTSTAMRDEFTNRINRGDRRHHAVIPPGADGLGVVSRTDLPASREFVVVGTLEPRKQPLRILEAFVRIRNEGHDARLCFAGRMGWLKPEDKESLLSAFDSFNWVRWIDSPDDIDLRRVVANARATIYISIAEGFGSPPVESLALGVPCIVSRDIPSMRDLAGNGQIRVDPLDTDTLAAAIRAMLRDDVCLAKQHEIATLQLPTWQGFAEGIAALVEQKAPADVRSTQRPSTFVERVASIRLLSRLDSLPQPRLISAFVQLLAGTEPATGAIEAWIEQADAMAWDKAEALLQIATQAYPGKFDQRILSQALNGRLNDEAHLRPAPVKLLPALGAKIESVMLTGSNADFERGCYQYLLLRAPHNDELTQFASLDAGQFSRVEVISAFLTSDEFEWIERDDDQRRGALQLVERLAGVAAARSCMAVASDDDFVLCAYRGLFGREPDAPGAITHKTRLQTGWSRALVLAHMFTSEEYDKRIADVDRHLDTLLWLVEHMSLEERRMTALDGLSRPEFSGISLALELDLVMELESKEFISRAFSLLFGKKPDKADRDTASSRLAQGATHRLIAQNWVLQAALGGRISASEQRLVEWAAKGLTTMLYERGSIDLIIELGYQVVLDRVPDPNGRATWIERIENGMSVFAFITQLLSSDEYRERLPNQTYTELLANAVSVADMSAAA